MAGEKKYEKQLSRVLFYALFVVGISLRLYQHFLFNRPLHEDEAHLALNFMDSGYLEMFMPLKHFQSAPIIFLLMVETFTNLFGFSEVVLRSFPFIIALFSYPLFYYFVKDMTGSKLTAIIAFSLFTFSPFIIYYSSEVKPYVIELSAFIYLGYIVFSKNNYVAQHREKLLLYAGIISLFLANLSMIVLGCIVMYRIYLSYHIKYVGSDKEHTAVKQRNTRLFIRWSIAFAANIILNIILNPVASSMRKLWVSTFIPFNIFSREFLSFIELRTYESLFTYLFLFKESVAVYVLFFGTAIVSIWYMLRHKKYPWLAFSVLPFLAQAFLSWVQLYPFYHRFVLQLMPPVIIILAIGLTVIVQYVGKVITRPAAIGAALVFLCFVVAGPMAQFPYGDKNVFPALNYINSYPATTKLYTTTPKTLYEYYYKQGYTKNPTREEVAWYISPEEYYGYVGEQDEPYLLFHSRYDYDGYQRIVNALNDSCLILDSFAFSDYRVVYVQPATEPSLCDSLTIID